jgi:glycerol-3-phosphate dehydrogenase (NAD(P)+)
MKTATVLGAGSWGTALACFLAQRGLAVQFWGRDPELMAQIRVHRCNERYLPQLQLPATVHATHEMTALEPSDLLVYVVPSSAMRTTAQAAAQAGVRAPVVLSCTKGIEHSSGKCMSEVLEDLYPQAQMAVLSGPNHAEEVALQQPTAAVIATAQQELAQELQSLFTADWFRSYTTQDVTGVEWAGAMKNPYAIAAGIARGLNLGDNAIAALVTRSLAEMTRIGTAAGGQPETFAGLSGLGDLVATCYSLHSRNNRLGMALGQGQRLADIMAATRMIAEGVPNTLSLHRAARQKGVRSPMLDAIHAVLYEGVAPQRALADLLSRQPRPENS